MTLTGSIANQNRSVKWSPLFESSTKNAAWIPAENLKEKFSSGRHGWSHPLPSVSQKSGIHDQILFQVDKSFSKSTNTAILNFLLQILIEAVGNFLRRPVSVDNEADFEVEVFDPSHFVRRKPTVQTRVKRSVGSFLSTTILKIWDFIKSQIVFVIKLIIPAPVFNLVQTLVNNLLVPLQKIFDLIKSLVEPILKKLFSNSTPKDNFGEELDEILQEFSKQLAELLKSYQNFH